MILGVVAVVMMVAVVTMVAVVIVVMMVAVVAMIMTCNSGVVKQGDEGSFT